MKRVITLALTAVVGACGQAADRADTTDTTAADTGMAGHSAMGGMSGMAGMISGPMMDSMHTHMSIMDTMGVAALKPMVPMHRQMMGNMLSQMNREMQSMNMSADAKWTALIDSVRQDLVRLPDVADSQLKSFMSAHHGRVMRLTQGHREMMKGMQGAAK